MSLQPPNSLRGQQFLNAQMLEFSEEHLCIVSFYQAVSQILNFLNFVQWLYCQKSEAACRPAPYYRRRQKINLFQGSVGRRGRAYMRKRAGRTFHPESAWTHFRLLAVQNRENGRRAVLSTISQFFPLFSLSFLWSQSGDLSVGMGRETRSNQSSSK